MFCLNISYVNGTTNNNSCSWDNRNEIPCISIINNTPNSSKFSKPGINKTVITKKQIIETGAVDLIDVLKTLPDINVTQSGPKGQQASVFMRGTGSNHTLVMINGIPVNDQSTTQGAYDFGVDFLHTVQQIEIYPGSSASHFGTNSIGGAINIILTGDFKDSFSITGDKDKNYEVSTNKTYLFDTSSLNIKFGSIKNETVSARGNKTDEKDELENYSTNINYENFLKDNKRIYNTIYLRQTKAEYDNSSTNQVGYEGDNRMSSFQFGLENLSKKKTENYVFYYNLYDREYDERGTLDTYESEVLGLKYNLSKTLNQKISMGAGSEYKYDWGKFTNNGSYEASTKGHSDNLSFYGNLGWNIFDDSNISIFARNDNHKQTGNKITYKANLDQAINNFNFGVSYMTGLRNPTLYEMFGTDNYGYSGNKNLKPEESNTYEIYSNINLYKNLNFSVRAFKSNIQNNIEYINNQYKNDTDNIDLNQSGLNSQIKFNDQNTSLILSSSLLSSKKENGADQLRRPRKNFAVNLRKKLKNNYFGKYNLSLNYNHYGKHSDTHSSNFTTIEMDSTDIIDLYLNKKVGYKEYFIKITNLLNENFQRPHGYNQDGRIIKIGLRY